MIDWNLVEFIATGICLVWLAVCAVALVWGVYKEWCGGWLPFRGE